MSAKPDLMLGAGDLLQIENKVTHQDYWYLITSTEFIPASEDFPHDQVYICIWNMRRGCVEPLPSFPSIEKANSTFSRESIKHHRCKP